MSDRICRLCGTLSRIEGRGLCKNCYQNVSYHGRLKEFPTDRVLTDIDGWLTQMAAVTECWPWPWGLDAAGYGRANLAGGSTLAHRQAYERLKGPIPKGHTLDHECHNEAAQRGECTDGPSCLHRRCTNPAHLVPRLLGDNVMRGLAPSAQNKRKTHCKRGHPLAGEHLYLPPAGGRRCLTCQRDRRVARERPRVRTSD